MKNNVYVVLFIISISLITLANVVKVEALKTIGIIFFVGVALVYFVDVLCRKKK
jgi:hypothetical protein